MQVITAYIQATETEEALAATITILSDVDDVVTITDADGNVLAAVTCPEL